MKKPSPGVIELFGQDDLPPGRVFQCQHCFTRLKEGSPHSAMSPYPHQSLAANIVRAAKDERHHAGWFAADLDRAAARVEKDTWSDARRDARLALTAAVSGLS